MTLHVALIKDSAAACSRYKNVLLLMQMAAKATSELQLVIASEMATDLRFDPPVVRRIVIKFLGAVPMEKETWWIG